MQKESVDRAAIAQLRQRRGLVKKGSRIAIVVVTVSLLAGVGAWLTSAGNSGTTALTPGNYTIKTTLNTKQEVPKLKGTTTASGQFTGTLKITSATKATLVWKLTFAHLTGAALASHVHLGVVGKSGKIVVPLCAPCRSGAHGSKPVTAVAAAAMVSGKAYVNVHTKTNPAGEIRGQVKAKAAATSGNPYANVTVATTPALVAAGKSASSRYSCEGCHTLDGTSSTGPTWKGLAGRTIHLNNGQTVKATDGYLIWSIEQPDAQIVAGYSSGVMTTAIGNISLSQAKA